MSSSVQTQPSPSSLRLHPPSLSQLHLHLATPSPRGPHGSSPLSISWSPRDDDDDRDAARTQATAANGAAQQPAAVSAAANKPIEMDESCRFERVDEWQFAVSGPAFMSSDDGFRL
eukprot:m51a1_g5408 hypothetical protein (116) ;mRNA; f:78387-78734